jgi:hypothetical protein
MYINIFFLEHAGELRIIVLSRRKWGTSARGTSTPEQKDTTIGVCCVCWCVLVHKYEMLLSRKAKFKS